MKNSRPWEDDCGAVGAWGPRPSWQNTRLMLRGNGDESEDDPDFGRHQDDQFVATHTCLLFFISRQFFGRQSGQCWLKN